MNRKTDRKFLILKMFAFKYNKMIENVVVDKLKTHSKGKKKIGKFSFHYQIKNI